MLPLIRHLLRKCHLLPREKAFDNAAPEKASSLGEAVTEGD